MKTLYLLVATFILTACQHQEASPTIKQGNKQEQADTSYSYKIIFTDEVGWGYQIFQGSKMIVDQKHIPAIQGLHGFTSKTDAETVAQHVLKKLNNDLFPPTVNEKEMDSLGIVLKHD